MVMVMVMVMVVVVVMVVLLVLLLLLVVVMVVVMVVIVMVVMVTCIEMIRCERDVSEMWVRCESHNRFNLCNAAGARSPQWVDGPPLQLSHKLQGFRRADRATMRL